MKIEYKCRFCNRTIKRKDKLKIHEEHCWSNPKNKDILNCEFCGKNFKKPGALGIHRRSCFLTVRLVTGRLVYVRSSIP